LRAAPSEICGAKWGDPSCAENAIPTSGAQVRAARALLRWSVQDLSHRSGVSISTIRRIEDETGHSQNREKRMLQSIQKTLEDAGVCFGSLAGGGAGVGLNA
jgi:DNA-binding transcriptional regulator YiaG